MANNYDERAAKNEEIGTDLRDMRNMNNAYIRKWNAKTSGLQTQLNEIVADGDSSVEAAQARVDSENNSFATLKERLDTKEDSFTAQLATNEQIRGVNVEDFKRLAVETTDSGRFQRAMNHAQQTSKILLMDSKIYDVVGIEWHFDVILIGKFRNTSFLRKCGNGDVLTVVGGDETNTPRFGKAMSFTIMGEKDKYTGHGIVGTKLRGFYFTEIEVKNCRGNGFYMIGSWDTNFFGCWARGNLYGFYDEALPDSNSNNLRWIGCHIEGNGLGQIHSTSANAGEGGRNMQHYISETKIEAQLENGGMGGVYLDADQCQIVSLYTYRTQDAPLLYLKGNRNRVVGSFLSTPNESYCLVIEGDYNIIDDSTITTTSEVLQWVSIKNGKGNRINVTLTGGGTQNLIEDLGVDNYWDIISPKNERLTKGTVRPHNNEVDYLGTTTNRYARIYSKDVRVDNLLIKEGHSINLSQSINSGIGSSTVIFNIPQSDGNYNVNIQPRWNTTWWIVSRSSTEFRVDFGSPPTTNATFGWSIIRSGA